MTLVFHSQIYSLGSIYATYQQAIMPSGTSVLDQPPAWKSVFET